MKKLNNLLLKSYLKCKRKAWLEYKGDKKNKTWSAQNSIQLINQYKNFNKFTCGEIFSNLRACERGYKGVIGLKIKSKLNQTIDINVFPSLLLKTAGNSKWGDYKYIPVISKLGRRTTKEHLIDLAFCSIPLENLEGTQIDYGLILSNYNKKLSSEKIRLNKKLKKRSIEIVTEMAQTLKGNIPEITEDRKKCSICHWQKFCDKEAKFKGFLTDIDGIGKKTASIFKKIGISNFYELAESNKSEVNKKLHKLQETDPEKTNKFINQAKSYTTGLPIKISNAKNINDLFLKKDSGFFVFDIESDPDNQHDFLFGFLSVKDVQGEKRSKIYEPILNLDNDNNLEHIEKIFKKLFSQHDWPVLHYGETEKIAILKLAKKVHLDKIKIDQLKDRFLDLHQIIRSNWILPIKNYSLKTVANWTGFNWGSKNVNGSKALFWWFQYKETNNTIFLKKIIEYNKDDCSATLKIAEWLIHN